MKVVVDPEEHSKRSAPQSPIHRSIEWYRGFHSFVLAEPSLKPIADLFGGEAVRDASGADLVRLHTKAVGFFHRLRDPNLAHAFSRILDAYAGLNTEEMDDTAIAGPLQTLNELGYADLAALPDDNIRDMLSFLEASLLVPSDALRRPEAETPGREASALRQDCNLAYVPRSRLLRMPGLLPLAVDPQLLELIRRYLGAPPILTDISAWRSFAGDHGPKEARDAQLFHFDLDNYRFCKVFIYLTDVDEESGPHIFVPTTHRLETIRAKRPMDGTPEQTAFDQWYYETVRKSESAVTKWFETEPVAITGKSGTRFIADTKGLHRGCPPSNRDRWVLQFVYGTTPATLWFQDHHPPAFKNSNGSGFRASGELAHYCLKILFPSAK